LKIPDIISHAQPNADNVNIPSSIYEALIAWSVKLNSGLASELDFNGFKAWCAQDPLHEMAWKKLQSLEQSIAKFPLDKTILAAETLEQAAKQRTVNVVRRRTTKLLSVAAAGLIGIALLANSYRPWQQDTYYVAAIGKREHVILADGTSLLLNTNSKVDVKFSLFKREVVLYQGEIYIETGKDADSIVGRRAFWVKTEQAALEAIGTRFVVNQQVAVNQHASATRLHVAEGIVAMHIANKPPVLAYANDTYTLHNDADHPVKNESSRNGVNAGSLNLDGLNLDPMGWVSGVLITKQMRLQDFATELSRYQNTPVVCDPSASELLVSGVFQLDRLNPVNHALGAIARTLPIRIQSHNDAIVITKK